MLQTNAAKKSSSKFDGHLLNTILKVLLIILFLFIFLVGVKSLATSIKLMGGGFAKTLFDLTSNPISSLFAGLLATALIQSSSASTSIIVGLVSSGAITIGGAVPMIMGANLGTSITNTLVSLAYVKNKKNFNQAFSAATIHDIFNILSVMVFLPIELATGVLQKIAVYFTDILYGAADGLHYKSPIKKAIKPMAKGIETFIYDTIGLEGKVASSVMLIVSALIIFTALASIVRVTKTFVESNKNEIVENLLSNKPIFAMLFGVALTISVQSSSITTSLLVPMAGSGLITLNAVLPVTVGANIGTTTTALLASLTGNHAGLSIALVHFFFNTFGALLWFVPARMRAVPVRIATRLGELAGIRKRYAMAYIVVVFVILPLVFTQLI